MHLHGDVRPGNIRITFLRLESELQAVVRAVSRMARRNCGCALHYLDVSKPLNALLEQAQGGTAIRERSAARSLAPGLLVEVQRMFGGQVTPDRAVQTMAERNETRLPSWRILRPAMTRQAVPGAKIKFPNANGAGPPRARSTTFG